mgnify:CR=1 FL=1
MQKQCPKCKQYNVVGEAGLGGGFIGGAFILGFFGLFLPFLLIPALIVGVLGIGLIITSFLPRRKHMRYCLNCHYKWEE